ncbi:SDR family NAD(P)-dependent oxidoreductase [Deinococcus radiomollis]|uniref:SDR family NAD(P)-dependent oxidoreductase n=1 Tax=Deinococcus radiomollis TaxID=468916 RepID=UPI003892B3F3
MTDSTPNLPERRTVVLLTGASSGIGEATARHLATLGYALVLTARRAELLGRLADELGAAGTPVLTVAADVSDQRDRLRLVQAALERFGRIDALINNAGISIAQGHWWDAPDPLRVLDVNLLAPIELTRLVLPAMLERGSGSVVNIGSVAGRVATHGMYSASKFGLRGFSLSLRREVLHTGVAVSLVSPGFIRTPLTAGTRLPMPGPEVVAQAVAEVLLRPRREVFAPAWYGPLSVTETLLPGLSDHLVRRIMGVRYVRSPGT